MLTPCQRQELLGGAVPSLTVWLIPGPRSPGSRVQVGGRGPVRFWPLPGGTVHRTSRVWSRGATAHESRCPSLCPCMSPACVSSMCPCMSPACVPACVPACHWRVPACVTSVCPCVCHQRVSLRVTSVCPGMCPSVCHQCVSLRVTSVCPCVCHRCVSQHSS